MPTWTSEQVASLAPDGSSVVAARGLAAPRLWSSTGFDDRAVWGQIRGYSVAIDLAGPERPSERGGRPAASCTCPSRKVPCKHGLALLMLWAAHPDAVAPAEAPEWVEEWLAGRARRAARDAVEKKPVDPEARAKRMAGRAARIGAGLEELDLWLGDLVRQGLASSQGRPFSYWDEVAARMVDAQAPGVGGQVRRMAGIVRSGDGWPGRLLVQAGRLHLLARAWSRFDALPPETQADLRAVTGWSWTSDEVLAGPPVRDRWSVVARSIADEERFRIVRTWLVGRETGRIALLLEFLSPYDPLPSALGLGTTVDADLAFFPGAWPQRALLARAHGEAEPMSDWEGSSTVEDALAGHARALAANPWLDRLPMVLSDVVPLPDGGRVRDRTGAAVRLLVDKPAWWTLVAVSGGRPVGVAGEWQDGALRALAVWADRALTPLV
ncbi:MAG TPA: SWIM zinc finger family protein [Acidimicrobiales bacterium]|nr:SWIM zinc finger family protein [Acidimicrobiales bacterium]